MTRKHKNTVKKDKKFSANSGNAVMEKSESACVHCGGTLKVAVDDVSCVMCGRAKGHKCPNCLYGGKTVAA